MPTANLEAHPRASSQLRAARKFFELVAAVEFPFIPTHVAVFGHVFSQPIGDACFASTVATRPPHQCAVGSEALGANKHGITKNNWMSHELVRYRRKQLTNEVCKVRIRIKLRI